MLEHVAAECMCYVEMFQWIEPITPAMANKVWEQKRQNISKNASLVVLREALTCAGVGALLTQTRDLPPYIYTYRV
jgi:hypothetical protein